MRSGSTYPLPTSERLISESESSLWPTPTGQDAANDAGPSQWERNSDPLNVAVKRWPTPKGSPSGPDYARAGRPASGGDDLATAIGRRYMTPTATVGPKAPSGHRGTKDTLGAQIAAMEGMPQASTGQLNPMWVEWLMGFPLGWTDLGDSATPSSRKSRRR